MRNDQALEVFMSTIAKAYATDVMVTVNDVIAVSNAFYDMAFLDTDQTRILGNGSLLKPLPEAISGQNFYSTKMPTMGFADFVFHMYKYTNNTLSNVLAAFRFMCDYLKSVGADASSALDPLMAHRLFFVCLCVASKVNLEEYRTTKTYGVVAGVPALEAIHLEKVLVSSLGYHFHATDTPCDMERFLQVLVDHGPVSAAGIKKVPVVYERNKNIPTMFGRVDGMPAVVEHKEACDSEIHPSC